MVVTDFKFIYPDYSCHDVFSWERFGSIEDSLYLRHRIIKKLSYDTIIKIHFCHSYAAC